jgi:hypothetical protein
MTLSEFFHSKPTPVPLTVQRERTDRQHSLRTQLNELDSELELLNEHCAKFRTAHMTLVSNKFVFLSPDMESLPQLQEALFAMQVRAGEIAAERSGIMAEMIRLQEQDEQEERERQIAARSLKEQLSAVSGGQRQ